MNFMMKNLLVLFIILSFTACEKITDDVIESQFQSISVIDITAPAEFNYSESNTDIIISIELSSANQVGRLWFNIISRDGSERIAETVLMRDDGNLQESGDASANDNIFSGKYSFTDEIVSGEYLIEFYVEDNVNYDPQNVRKLVSHSFDLSTGVANEPPVLSDLNITASVNRDVAFTYSVRASDPNGAMDIYSVTYELYDPDGVKSVNSQGISRFPMSDSGDVTVTGDQTAGDGIYTYRLAFPPSVATGTWQFRFQAKDGADALSNIITHNIEVN